MKPIKQMLDISPTRMKRKLSKVTAALLFTSGPDFALNGQGAS